MFCDYSNIKIDIITIIKGIKDTFHEEEVNMKINLEELKDNLYGWYYEGYVRGIDSFLSVDEARVLFDCLEIVNKAIENNQEFIIESENRP